MKLPPLRSTVAALLLLLQVSCGGHDRSGALCARCGDEDPCQANALLTSEDDIFLFCGTATRQNCNICRFDENDLDDDPATLYVCEVALQCFKQSTPGTNARQCYPVRPDPLGVHPDYVCDGAKPAV